MRTPPPLAEARPSSTHLLSVLWSLIAVCVLALFPLHTLVAQGKIVGTVRDATGAGIVGAQITIAGSEIHAASDTAGQFVLARVPAGATTLLVRRLGFAPASVTVIVVRDSTVHTSVIISEVSLGLAPVVVRAERPPSYTGYMAGFYKRRDEGFGHFITGDEIEQRNPGRLTDMLRSIPGVSVMPGYVDSRVRMRGNRCAPLVWIDGTAAAAAEFDVDVLMPTSIAGIEIYTGVATVPPQFVMPFGRTSCGTIIIWSRHGKAPPRGNMTVTQLEALLKNLQVYTADQVDEPARADTSALAAPVYPEALYKSRTPGQVIAEFVVDTTGEADPATFGVVSSSDARFTEAVRAALRTARFTPAILRGDRVRQIVRQSFTFVV
ncbi:MAG: TonB family protein, partial [Gemmatimonadaceae bacterium]